MDDMIEIVETVKMIDFFTTFHEKTYFYLFMTHPSLRIFDTFPKESKYTSHCMASPNILVQYCKEIEYLILTDSGNLRVNQIGKRGMKKFNASIT